MAPATNEPSYSEPSYAKAENKTTNLPFYTPNIDKYLLPETRKLFENYSKIPQDQLSQHVHAIRDQAWAIRTYPCIGLGAFLVPFMPRSQDYPTILARVKAGAIFLDIGCFLGADMRQLAFDGAPTDNMYGVDIVNCWDVGNALYRDTDSFKAKFILADVLSTDNPALQALEGRCDVISVSAVLHQWDWDDQVKAAKRIVAFSKPQTLLMGHQIGISEGRREQNKALGKWSFMHNAATFAKLWQQVGKETGTKWETKARERTFADVDFDPKDSAWMDPQTIVLDFVVNRLE